MKQDNPQQADIYAAGFFDGEGSIAMYVGSGINRKGIVFAVSIYQNNFESLEYIANHFGGNIYERKDGMNLEWRVTGHQAYAFLSRIVGYSIVKRNRIEEAMYRWENRAAAETEWKDIPFSMRNEATVRPAWMTQHAEGDRNDLLG